MPAPLSCGAAADAVLLPPTKTVPPDSRIARICTTFALGLSLFMTLPTLAHAQTGPATVPASSANAVQPLGGDFELEGDSGSTLQQLKFRGKPYRPLNAYKFAHIRALGPTQGGQPILLAVSNDFMGVGTILIAVQNGTPLARVLSPSVDVRDPDMGLAQPGRQDLLLFTAGSRALVTSTGKVLWFEHLQPKERLQSTPLLVSVSPDNRHGAVLLDNEIRLSVADEGPYATVPFTRAMQRDAFKPAWDQSAARARKALDEGKHIDQRRLYDNMRAEWINRNFRWLEGKGGWQFVGQGLKPIALPVQPRKEQ